MIFICIICSRSFIYGALKQVKYLWLIASIFTLSRNCFYPFIVLLSLLKYLICKLSLPLVVKLSLVLSLNTSIFFFSACDFLCLCFCVLVCVYRHIWYQFFTGWNLHVDNSKPLWKHKRCVYFSRNSIRPAVIRLISEGGHTHYKPTVEGKRSRD